MHVCRGCVVDEADQNQTTPLHLAVQHNHSNAVKMLLDGGAGTLNE